MTKRTKKPDCCASAAEHDGHICELESQQEWEIIRQVTDNPRFRCENCGNQANAARNLCMPEEL